MRQCQEHLPVASGEDVDCVRCSKPVFLVGMGIPRFATRMESYGSHRVIGSTSKTTTVTCAIIDGPSLAHFVYHEFKKGLEPVALFEANPDYSSLGLSAVAWLQRLERHGFEIGEIFFDGALPSYKRETRIRRLQQSTSNLISFRHLSYEIENQKRHQSRKSNRPKGPVLKDLATSGGDLAPPPFLVIAVLEKLVKSRFSDRIHVVPGEADPFCAAAALEAALDTPERPITIFTNDSDLLIYESAEHVKIVMMNSMVQQTLNDGISILQGQEFWPFSLAKNADASWTNLIAPAFQMRDPHVSFKQALSSCRRDFSSVDFDGFAAEYDVLKAVEQLPSLKLRKNIPVNKSVLDPRVSELVVAATDVFGRASSTQAELNLFLPALFEDPSRASAWTFGRTFRELAISILLHRKSTITCVFEFRRSGTRIKPLKIDVPSDEILHDLLSAWTGYMKNEMQIINSGNKAFDWLILIMRLLLSEMINFDMATPETRDISVVVAGDTINTWPNAHLSAQFQAIFYSIRILVQISTFAFGAFASDEKFNRAIQNFVELVKVFPDINVFSNRKGATSALNVGEMIETYVESLV